MSWNLDNQTFQIISNTVSKAMVHQRNIILMIRNVQPKMFILIEMAS